MKKCLIQSCKGGDMCQEHCPCDCHKKIKDISAFPLSPEFNYKEEYSLGMSLLDYFAGKALNGLLASGQNHTDGSGDDAMYAKQAYWFAEAMLKEREKYESR